MSLRFYMRVFESFLPSSSIFSWNIRFLHRNLWNQNAYLFLLLRRVNVVCFVNGMQNENQYAWCTFSMMRMRAITSFAWWEIKCESLSHLFERDKKNVCFCTFDINLVEAKNPWKYEDICWIWQYIIAKLTD